ncbi:nuclear transport factor 2 family protein [Inhella proteolytica]|uniref:Nuclear transport factor 2 family protein n=1 Tax=Inhella proteolytica TaxID=2795029 RepID=A0A931J5Q8_9BURK|nr:nuclear transport factor 2 family protein [Inhella proteolytica]MBH9578308.1 nuclear transport factor 2 family protein [Inhella proteolytica]
MKAADFIALERRRTQALVQRDIATARALHAPEYQLITPGGGAFSREQYLDKIERGELVYLGWELGEVAVRQGTDMALLRYRATLTLAGGEERPFQVWHTDSYELREGQWLAVWSQATAIKA